MTYLNWGCDPLEEECRSCLDALCYVCVEEYKKKSRAAQNPDGLEEFSEESGEPDCDRCDVEKKPDCSHCEIILAVCRKCAEHETCEFRISE
jgi:hypothetical protein